MNSLKGLFLVLFLCAISTYNGLAQTYIPNFSSTDVGFDPNDRTQLLVRPQGSRNNLGHYEFGNYGDILGNSKWLGLGSAPAGIGASVYGNRIQWNSNFAVFNLRQVNNSQRDLVIQWGGNNSNNLLRFEYASSPTARGSSVMTINRSGTVTIPRGTLQLSRARISSSGSDDEDLRFFPEDDFVVDLSESPNPLFLVTESGNTLLSVAPGRIDLDEPVLDVLVGNTTNALYRSNFGRFGEASRFNFNPNSGINGIVLEGGDSESGGFYADGDYAVIWSPGNFNRLLRIYDEDLMNFGSGTNAERAYIDGDGDYFKVSDKRLKKDISPIKGALDKILAIEGKTYFYKNPAELGAGDDSKEKTSRVDTQKEIGFIAQNLEKIVPEAVQTDDYGNKFVSYDAIIPVLVEAFKEQQNQKEKEISQLKTELASLKNQIETLSRKWEGVNSDDESNENIKTGKLFQNVPNPFSQSTNINYFLADDVRQARVNIYDMTGKLIKSYPLADKGKASLIIQNNELRSGIYTYALIADGVLVGTSKMIVE